MKVMKGKFCLYNFYFPPHFQRINLYFSKINFLSYFCDDITLTNVVYIFDRFCVQPENTHKLRDIVLEFSFLCFPGVVGWYSYEISLSQVFIFYNIGVYIIGSLPDCDEK